VTSFNCASEADARSLEIENPWFGWKKRKRPFPSSSWTVRAKWARESKAITAAICTGNSYLLHMRAAVLKLQATFLVQVQLVRVRHISFRKPSVSI
jgi:hypothetical protein